MNSFIITALVGMSSYVYGHLAEYLIHRFVLHKHGLKKSSLLSFHFSNHHKSSRVNGFIDNLFICNTATTHSYAACEQNFLYSACHKRG